MQFLTRTKSVRTAVLANVASKAIVFAFGLLPPGSGEQFRRLPTPAEVERQIIERLLASHKRSLATLQAAIKKIEEEPDPRVRELKAPLLKRFKEIEADDLKRIESLERGRLTPPPVPVMSVAPPERTKPKPPIRD